MKLADAATSSYVPKLIGAYERELHSVVEEIINYSPNLLVDVGCGEGYYLVEFARRLPNAVCMGFDIDEVAKAACRKQAEMNGVSSRVKIEGRYDHSILKGLSLE